MFIPQIADLKARINDLIIKSTSIPSSSSETSTSASNNACKEPAPPPKYAIKKPSIRLFPETQAPLPTINIVTKHSHAFNSSKAAGLDKLEQLQFAEAVKGWIVETAPLLVKESSNNTTCYKVIFTARKARAEIHTALRPMTSTTLYTAKLFAVTPTTSGNRWRLVEQSHEMDTLVDAIEDLWDRVMYRVGRLTGVMEIGAVVKDGKMIREREEKIERKSVGW